MIPAGKSTPDPECAETFDPSGALVTVIRRTPQPGEHGWYVDAGTSLHEVLADLLSDPRHTKTFGRYGWRADRPYLSCAVTVITVFPG